MKVAVIRKTLIFIFYLMLADYVSADSFLANRSVDKNFSILEIKEKIPDWYTEALKKRDALFQQNEKYSVLHAPDGSARSEIIGVDGAFNLTVIKTDNGSNKIVKKNSKLGYSGLVFSPNGRYLAFLEYSAVNEDVLIGDLFLYDVYSESLLLVKKDIFVATSSWGPDNNKLIFSDMAKIYIFSVSDRSLSLVANGGGQADEPDGTVNYQLCFNFVWSADGREVVYQYDENYFESVGVKYYLINLVNPH
jgi:Tol biopolymer transport system component